MESLFQNDPTEGVRAKTSPLGGGALSIVVHAVVLLVLLGVLHRAPRIAPYQVPGTKNGMELLSYYSPGSRAQPPSDAAAKKAKPSDTAKIPHPALATTKPVDTPDSTGETGSANSMVSGLGQGEISLALEKYFPYPRPDLSALPHGTRGDVILDAVVGADGKIEELTLVQGLGPAIDSVVIATVKEWSYIPAMRGGVPVPSKQELHFHYERG